MISQMMQYIVFDRHGLGIGNIRQEFEPTIVPVFALARFRVGLGRFKGVVGRDIDATRAL